MKTNNLLFLSLMMFFFFGCTNNPEKGTNEQDTLSVEKENIEYSCTFTDNRDAKTYRCIKIGEQVWMAENLSYLPQVNAVSFDGHGYWVYGYNGTDVEEAKKTDNYKTYGVLYSQDIAKKVCPVGWHLPNKKEFQTLTDYLGGDEIAAHKLKLKDKTLWPNLNDKDTNESGFSAIPAGRRTMGYNASYNRISKQASFWTRTNKSHNVGSSLSIAYSGNAVVGLEGRESGFSVRCLKDKND